MTDELIIQQTNNWIKEVVIDCNFCPFAAKALFRKNIRYSVLSSIDLADSLQEVEKELIQLDQNSEIETTFIIFKNDYISFYDFLHLLKKAEQLLLKGGYEGTYQLASFHPLYCFSGKEENDPANYTNRSIYPMLHLLREESITKALTNFPHPETIPQNNIDYSEKKGLVYMQMLRAACIR
ncbi:MAG: DUF1415 domain-containing protein [Chitinophagales bacterium]